MKIVIWGVMALLACSLVRAQTADVPDEQVLSHFQWTDWSPQVFGNPPSTSFSTTYPAARTASPNGSEQQQCVYNLEYSADRSLQLTLRTLGPAITSQITARRYAITGKIGYSNISHGSYLEMWSYFAALTPEGSESAFFSRTLGDSGPMAQMEGTDDGRDFLLPFDATGAKTKLTRIEFNLHLVGKGTLHLWNVKLVQFPDTTLPATPAPPEAASPVHPRPLPETTSLIEWKSFLLGIAATGVLLLVGAGLIVLSRQLNRRRHEKELRRMASLDR